MDIQPATEQRRIPYVGPVILIEMAEPPSPLPSTVE